MQGNQFSVSQLSTKTYRVSWEYLDYLLHEHPTVLEIGKQI